MAIVDVLIQYWPVLLQAFETTLILAAAGFLVGAAIGLPLSLLETYA